MFYASKPCTARLSDGRLQLVVTDRSSALWTTWKNTTDPNAPWVPWALFQPPPNRLLSQLAAGTLPDGRPQLFAVDTSGGLQTTWKSTNDPSAPWAQWGALAPAPGALLAQIAVGTLPDGRLQLFGVDTSGVLQTTWKSTNDPNAPWVQWGALAPGPTFPVSQLAVAALPDKRLQLFAVNPWGGLQTTWKSTNDPNAPWVPWSFFAPAAAGQLPQVAVGTLPDGRLQLFAVDASGALQSTWKYTTDPNSGWSAWSRLYTAGPGALPLTQAAVGSLPDGRLQLFVVDAAGNLQSTWKLTADPNAGWAGWSPFSVEPNQLHWHQDITLPGGVPVGGWTELTLNSDGSYEFSSHFHDSGFPNYQVTVAFAVRGGDGVAYTFAAQGNVQGTESGFNPQRDWDQDTKGSNQALASGWTNLAGAYGWRWRADASIDINQLIQDLLNDLQQAVGVIEKVVAVVGPLVAVFAAKPIAKGAAKT